MSRPVADTERRVVALLALLAFGGCTQATTTAAPPPAPAPPATSLIVTPTSPLKDFGTMWTFDAPPLAYWKARYGFDAPKEWLDHVRLSAVRIPGCSASIVSPDGLVMTNHHCARACTTESSARDSNYIETGFVAVALNDEKKCRGMTADQLQS
ncbi:MAG TPA: S46 family peptidase, partial [Gemmatimonadaceae bacterium]|nr:S46 family peptidase [Gemmatimonadaceae bacterium]